jgi:AraC-like DNA-binding protein
LAKIARELEHALARRRESGTAGRTAARVIASGDGWTAADVVCTCGPHDHPYEEQHTRNAIAIVLAGSFEYRSPTGHGLMTAGSLMLGSHGHSFECAHRHGEGDRCVAFWYSPDYFERLAADARVRRSDSRFMVPGVPPLRELSPLVARAGAGLAAGTTKVLDVALDCGFGDVSNVNRAFRGEFGVSPRALRRALRRSPA